MTDRIVIDSLELQAHIGVADEERATPQRLTVSLVLEPLAGFSGLDDQIDRAVDYALVCQAAQQAAADSSCRLIETLAENLAAELLRQFPLRAVELELRKFILEETAHVAVRLRREETR